MCKLQSRIEKSIACTPFLTFPFYCVRIADKLFVRACTGLCVCVCVGWVGGILKLHVFLLVVLACK